MTREELLHLGPEELVDRVLTSQARLAEVEHQLRWFKRQLFGSKSERQVPVDDATQLYLGEGLAPERETPDEGGLRFDASVPVETIVVPNPELEGLPEDACAEVSEKITYRLAQQPAAYKVLKIVRPVVKRRDTGALASPPAPPAVLEKSYADVSLLAGMLVDKFRHHLPLYRQHQRL